MRIQSAIPADNRTLVDEVRVTLKELWLQLMVWELNLLVPGGWEVHGVKGLADTGSPSSCHSKVSAGSVLDCKKPPDTQLTASRRSSLQGTTL